MQINELLSSFLEGRAALKDIKALPPEQQNALVAAAQRLADSGDKAQAKAAKKALYQLKSAGLSVPEKKAEAPLAAAPESKDEELRGIVSPILGNGERLLLVPRAVRGGGLEMIQAVFNDELGIVQLTLGDSNRSQYKKQLKLMKEGKGVSAIDIPRDEALRLLGHALWLNSQSGNAPPPNADAVVRHVGAKVEPYYPELPPPQDGDATLAVEGYSLHDEPEIQAWLPPEEELRRLGLKMDEVATSKLYVDDAQRGEQLARVFVKAAEDWFTRERKQLYARRLWEMARYFDATNRQRKAELARAEARRLFHDAPGLFSPFAQRLFEKVLMFTQTLNKGGALPAPPKTLITP